MANVNEGERWEMGLCPDCGHIADPSVQTHCVLSRHAGSKRLQRIEVVRAKALREAREELERLRELCRANGLDYGATPRDSESANQPVRDGSGAALIATERARQVAAEGWTPEHDDMHTKSELTWAAVHYLGGARPGVHGWCWPWSADTIANLPRSHGQIRDLTRAGALIAAEIDRLRRAESLASEPKLDGSGR